MKQNPYNKEIFNKIVDKMIKLEKKSMNELKKNNFKQYYMDEGAANILRWVLRIMQGGK